MLATIQGTIVRRVLVNYRVRPEAIEKILPAPFRPQLVDDWSIAGICLIGLRDIRPVWLPACFGCTSENAAHRIAVEWDEQGSIRRGVFIPRRDSSSVVNHMAGGRLFPGEHHAAKFTVHEDAERVCVEFFSHDATTSVRVVADICDSPPAGSVIRDTAEAASFFKSGCVGYSARAHSPTLDGVELCCDTGNMRALNVQTVSSSFFDDLSRFGKGEVALDSAFLMRQVPHRWIGRPEKNTSRAASHASERV